MRRVSFKTVNVITTEYWYDLPDGEDPPMIGLLCEEEDLSAYVDERGGDSDIVGESGEEFMPGSLGVYEVDE